LGLAFPNAAALALTPFEKNAGSASALLGFVQIGAASLASACVGLFNSKTMLPMLVTFAATSWVALAIYIVGRRYVATEDSSPKNETASVIH
jgi:MFS transporter, DHA1 family, multidrug resistance protein